MLAQVRWPHRSNKHVLPIGRNAAQLTAICKCSHLHVPHMYMHPSTTCDCQCVRQTLLRLQIFQVKWHCNDEAHRSDLNERKYIANIPTLGCTARSAPSNVVNIGSWARAW